jgi:RNA polymerase sigma factor (sigma-70 family)
MGDERLVARVRAGDDDAFEAIYDRYYLGLLAFCRHMLGSRQEAEDALQHSFASAYRALRRDDYPAVELRPWLYTIARNRCLSALRARRDEVDIDGLEPERGALDGLPAQIQLRADLRDLVEDMQRLPDDQRAALVLFELGDHSHDEIGTVLGVRREKVKALVFQARSGLLRARRARDASCVEIREQIASMVGVMPKRGLVRAHIERCEACAAFEREVRRQRSALAAILPVVPSAGLKATVLGFALGGGGGAAAITGATVGGGAAAGSGAVAGALGTAGVATVAGGVAGGPAKVAGLGALGAKGLVTKVLAVVAVAGGGGEAAHHVVPQATGASRVTSFSSSPMSVLPQRVPMGHPAAGKQIAFAVPALPALPGPAGPAIAQTVPSPGAAQPDVTPLAPAPAPIAQRPIAQPPAAAPGPTVVAPTPAPDPSPGPSADPAPTATDPAPAPATTTSDPAAPAVESGSTDTPPATSGGTGDTSPAPSTTTPAPDPDAPPTTVPPADAPPADNPPSGSAAAVQS